MYNPDYKPETNFIPTPPVTVGEARLRAKYHTNMVRSPYFDINTSTGRYDWECLNYFNQIILTKGRKRN
jgi:hypothetical protein